MRLSQAASCSAALAAAILTGPSRADLPDEIQVYDDGFNKRGQLGLEIHANHSFGGQTLPAFAGEVTTGMQRG